jgi:type I restriction enzyme S subunit
MSEEKLVPKLRFLEFTDEWSEHKFENIFDIKNGLNKGKDYFGEGIRILNYMDVNKYELNTENTIKGLVELTDDEIERYSVKPNDLFFTRTSETSEEIGLTSAYMGNTIKCVFSGFLLRARPKIDLNSLFFAYYLRSPRQRNNIIKFSSITTRALISGGNLSKMKIKYPSIEEQNKIANLFLILDKKVELLEKKYREYQCFKKYLMQKLFAQELRFDDNCQYKTKQVKDFLIESKIEGIDDINKRLTVKLNLNGITVRESKTIEIEGATKQFIRKTGQFIYGKQNLHKGAFGIIPKELDGYLTSSDIPSFDFKGGIEPKWFYYYFARKSFYEKLENLSTGTGSKRISPKEFLNIKIIVPEFKEQHKIVCLLEKFDEKINGISNQIVQMNMFKKSLLQQMFV